MSAGAGLAYLHMRPAAELLSQAAVGLHVLYRRSKHSPWEGEKIASFMVNEVGL